MGYQRILPRVGGGGAGGFYNMAKDYSGGAINARSRMGQGSRTETTPPGKTVGGGIMAGAGMGLSGAMYGAMEGTKISPGWGSLIGAGVGLAAYFLS